jgi:hypothetical protein
MYAQTNYMLTKTIMAERQAEANKARLLKGDRFDQGSPIEFHGKTSASPRLLGHLIGLKHALGGRLGAAASAAPAR